MFPHLCPRPSGPMLAQPLSPLYLYDVLLSMTARHQPQTASLPCLATSLQLPQ